MVNFPSRFPSTNDADVGDLLLGDGAVGTPSAAFTSDPDTGLYRVGANTAALAGGGVQTLKWDDTVIYLPKGQLNFPATAVPSADANTLDDYEEGSFTPVVTFTTPGDLSVVYAEQNASYTKIGRQVTATITIRATTFTHTTASGNLNITGLPFTAAAAPASGRFMGALDFRGITNASYTNFTADIVVSTAVVDFRMGGSGGAPVSVAAADVPTGGIVILRATITYEV